MVFQLCYKSTVSIGVSSDDIQNIVCTAIERNSELNVTGCLVFFKNEFYQLLEGDEKDVLLLYESIKKDTRHFNVTLLNKERTQYRVFSSWNMALYYIDEERNSKSIIKKFKKRIALLNTLNYCTDTGLKFWLNVKKKITQENNFDLAV